MHAYMYTYEPDAPPKNRAKSEKGSMRCGRQERHAEGAVGGRENEIGRKKERPARKKRWEEKEKMCGGRKGRHAFSLDPDASPKKKKRREEKRNETLRRGVVEAADRSMDLWQGGMVDRT